MAQRAFEEKHPLKRAVNLTASSYWLHEAKALGLNLSELFGAALEAAVRDAERKHLERDIAAFAESYNKHVEDNGVFGETWRSW